MSAKTTGPDSHTVEYDSSKKTGLRIQHPKTASYFKGLLVGIVFAIAVFGIYGQVVDHTFINFDDQGYVVQNVYVNNGLTTDGFLWAFRSSNDLYWHPLTWLSHMLDVDLFGLTAGRHLLVNVFIHLLNTIGLFVILLRMTGTLWRSAFVAALFAIHPLNVESVAWIAARKNLLSTLFCFLTVGCYLTYCKRTTLSSYFLVIAVFALGLMAKPMLITLPFVLLLFDFWPLDRYASDKQERWNGLGRLNSSGLISIVAEKIPLVLVAGLSLIISIISVSGNTTSFDTVPLSLRAGNAAVSYLHYLFKFLWPLDLAAFYPFPTELPFWKTAGAFLILLAATLAVIRLAKKKPYLFVGWFWYLGTLVPVIGIIQAGLWPSMADRWTYIPLIGIYIILVWGTGDLLSNLKAATPILAALTAAMLCILTVISWLQVKHWKGSTALFEHAIAVTGPNTTSLNNLGNAYLSQGRTEDAIKHFTAAIELNPQHARALNNLGVAWTRKGEQAAAIECYRQALRVLPSYAEAHNNLGAALRSQGKYAAAIAHYARALQLKPGYAAAHYNIGLAFLHGGQISVANKHFEKAFLINPGNKAAENAHKAILKVIPQNNPQHPLSEKFE